MGQTQLPYLEQTVVAVPLPPFSSSSFASCCCGCPLRVVEQINFPQTLPRTHLSSEPQETLISTHFYLSPDQKILPPPQVIEEKT
ncbi:unnamed protein product [Mesocestoides corti]|uniref:Uncharacterized protein n=1 Tax=Mesocestoides corti TaxID=53468 RepID=A0A0R3UFG8_MESCO|nr:unnamed protein product [Mesocestoides corti]